MIDMLTRKHFQAVADILARADGNYANVVKGFSVYFKQENPKFDNEKWQKYIKEKQNEFR